MTTQHGPDLKAIHPSNGSKFSPNLHKYLAGKRRLASLRLQRVFVDQDRTLWLGYFDDDCFIGARLTQVLCMGAKTQTMAYIRMKDLVEVDGFWAKYEATGRCAIDQEHTMHFIGDDMRWSVKGDTRSCLWCGQCNQRQHERVIQSVRTEWAPAEPEAVTT